MEVTDNKAQLEVISSDETTNETPDSEEDSLKSCVDSYENKNQDTVVPVQTEANDDKEAVTNDSNSTGTEPEQVDNFSENQTELLITISVMDAGQILLLEAIEWLQQLVPQLV